MHLRSNEETVHYWFSSQFNGRPHQNHYSTQAHGPPQFNWVWFLHKFLLCRFIHTNIALIFSLVLFRSFGTFSVHFDKMRYFQRWTYKDARLTMFDVFYLVVFSLSFDSTWAMPLITYVGTFHQVSNNNTSRSIVLELNFFLYVRHLNLFVQNRPLLWERVMKVNELLRMWSELKRISSELKSYLL